MSSAESRPPARIGHQEREDAVRALAEHYALGRITSEEYEERVGLAWEGRTGPDLEVLFADLPDPHPASAAQGPGPSGWRATRPGDVPTARYPAPPQPWSGGPPAAHDPSAPFGRDPLSGRPYSDKSKIVSGVLQVLLPFGVGRFYSGHVGIGVAQLLVTLFTFGIGAIWPFIDGIVILAGQPEDPRGHPLRP